MKDVAGQGRSVIFVSHNMEAVQKLCTTGILLNRGSLIEQGPIEQVTRKYMEGGDSSFAEYAIPLPENPNEGFGYVHRVLIENEAGKAVPEIPVGASWQVRVFYRLNKATPDFVAGLGIVTMLDFPIRTSWSLHANYPAGEYEVVFKNQDLMLVSGQYKIVVGLSTEGRNIQYIDNTVSLSISEITTLGNDERILNSNSGLILNPMQVNITALK